MGCQHLMGVNGGLRALGVLGGSWGVISGVISRVSILTTHIRGLITPFITTHEPPSRGVVSFHCGMVVVLQHFPASAAVVLPCMLKT